MLLLLFSIIRLIADYFADFRHDIFFATLLPFRFAFFSFFRLR